MNRQRRLGLLCALLMFLMAALPACQRKPASSNPSSQGGDSSGKTSGEYGQDEYVDLGGMTVRIYSQWEMNPSKKDQANNPNAEKEIARWNLLQEKFNCKLETIVPGDYAATDEAYVTALNSGAVPAEIVYFDASVCFPSYLVNGFLAPVDGLFNMGDNSVWNASFSEGLSFNGKTYGVTARTPQKPTNVLFFNKRIFSGYDQLKAYDLYKLVEDKQWTWEKYREVAKAATILNSDGTTDIMGVACQGQPGSIANTALIVSNGNTFVEKNSEGKYALTLNQPNALAAMELTYKMAWEDKSFGVTGAFAGWTGSVDAWKQGKVAMFFSEYWKIKEYKEALANDEIGVLPIPMGPTQTDYVNDVAKPSFWGIVPGSQRQADIAKLIEALARPQEYDIPIEESLETDLFDQESVDIMVALSKNPTYTFYSGYAQLTSNFLWGDYGLPTKTPPATIVAERASVVQRGIDLTWTADS